MKYYKFLTVDNKGEYSEFNFTEYLPKDGKPGKWLPKIKKIKICKSGYHAFELENILEWANAQLFEVELRGVSIIGDTKTVAQQMRFVRKVEAWNDKTTRLFACYCARDVLPIFEKEYPNDNRPRVAIDTSERYANGEATDSELSAAVSVAWSAVLVAARDEALIVAWDEALIAERYAAVSAAWSAARDAPQDAAMSAAWAAALAVAWATARDATWSAELSVARAQYRAHLIEMLGLEEK